MKVTKWKFADNYVAIESGKLQIEKMRKVKKWKFADKWLCRKWEWKITDWKKHEKNDIENLQIGKEDEKSAIENLQIEKEDEKGEIENLQIEKKRWEKWE